jgi:hypothetical protein
VRHTPEARKDYDNAWHRDQPPIHRTQPKTVYGQFDPVLEDFTRHESPACEACREWSERRHAIIQAEAHLTSYMTILRSGARLTIIDRKYHIAVAEAILEDL